MNRRKDRFQERQVNGVNGDLLQLFPIENRPFWKNTAKRQNQIQEIRLRVDRPVIVICDGKETFLDTKGEFTEHVDDACCAREEELTALFNHICHYSPYAFEDEIRQGFVTVEGGIAWESQDRWF